MKIAPVRTFLWLTSCAALLVGCGDSDTGSSADSGICGTAAEPGVLKLSNLTPPLGGSVVNSNLVHSFTIVNAPADYYDFDLLHGDGHSAGLSTPDSPRFTTTTSKTGNSITYQMTIDSWSNAPGHVVLKTNGMFDTTKGCRWVFPSPMFSYDVTPAPAPDGGTADSKPADMKPAIDGWQLPDAPVIDVASVDAPIGYDLAAESAMSVDSMIDAVAGSFDVSSELDGLPTLDMNVSVDAI
jgi:hypothetical protein